MLKIILLALMLGGQLGGSYITPETYASFLDNEESEVSSDEDENEDEEIVSSSDEEEENLPPDDEDSPLVDEETFDT